MKRHPHVPGSFLEREALMLRSNRALSPVACLLVLPLLLVLAGCGDPPPAEGEMVAQVHMLEDMGFDSPRAVIHDPVADVYLVTNQAGDAYTANEAGFISRVSPDGEMLELEWVPPMAPRGPLHAPSGLAIRGDSVFVADLDCIAVFDRETGLGDGRTCLDGVTRLSGLAVSPEGSLFTTDVGIGADGASTGTASVYRLLMDEAQGGATLARDEELGHPLGVDVGARGIFVVTTEPGQILRFTPGGEQTTIMTVPDGRFEGVTFTADGGFAYTSSVDSAVYLVDATGTIHPIVAGVDSPGDLGYDATRNRLLVPLTAANTVLYVDLE
jgi:hypothetical protein